MTVLIDQKSAKTESSKAVLKKPSSGYARQKLRMQHLYAQIDDLKLENDRLRQDISDLEGMFRELKQLNESLVADLRQTRQRPAANVLMGAHRG